MSNPTAAHAALEPAGHADASRPSRPVAHGDLLLLGRALLRPTSAAPTLTPLVAGHSKLLPFAVAAAEGPFFAKVSNVAARSGALAHERAWAAAAASLGLAPAVRGLASLAPPEATPWLLCTGLVAATTLQDAQLGKVDVLRRVLHAVRALHESQPMNVPCKAARTPQQRFDDAIALAVDPGCMAPHAAELLLELGSRAAGLLAQLSPAAVPVHGDFQRRNVLLAASGAPWLIDFADAGFGEPMTDLAHCALDAELPLIDVRSWAEAYQRGRPHDATLWPRLQLALFVDRVGRLADFAFWTPGEATVTRYAQWVADDFAQLEMSLRAPLQHSFAAWRAGSAPTTP